MELPRALQRLQHPLLVSSVLQIAISTEPQKDTPLHPFRRWHALLFSPFGLCSSFSVSSLFSLLCLFGLCTADPPVNHQRRHVAITFVKSSCQTLCVVLPCAVPAETSALVDLAGGAMVRFVPRSFQKRVNRTLHACSAQSASLDR